MQKNQIKWILKYTYMRAIKLCIITLDYSCSCQSNRGNKNKNPDPDIHLLIFISYKRNRILEKGIRIGENRIKNLQY